jgi:hypothetical protein
MAIKYEIIEGSQNVKNLKKKISKYSHAYEAVKQLGGDNIARIQFDNLSLLRGFQSQVNCNEKFRGKYATKSDNLILYVWVRV